MCRCVLQVLSAGSAAQAPDLEGREHAKKRFRAANLAHLHRLLYQVKANTKLERAVLSTNAQEQQPVCIQASSAASRSTLTHFPHCCSACKTKTWKSLGASAFSRLCSVLALRCGHASKQATRYAWQGPHSCVIAAYICGTHTHTHRHTAMHTHTCIHTRTYTHALRRRWTCESTSRSAVSLVASAVTAPTTAALSSQRISCTRT